MGISPGSDTAAHSGARDCWQLNGVRSWGHGGSTNSDPTVAGRSQAGAVVHDYPSFRHEQVMVAGSSLHVVEIGDPEGPPFLFPHGWPESWQSWRQVMTIASSQLLRD